MAKTNIERQLKELDALRKKGVLNDDEYATRRAAIMASPTQPDHAKRGGAFRWGFLGCLGIIGALAALVVVIVVIVAVTSGGGSSAAADVHVTLAKGSSGAIAAEGNSGKKSKVTILDIKDPATSTNEFERPAAGKKYVALNVEVENVGKNEVSSLDWKLRDSKDQEHDEDFVSGVGQGLEPFYNLTPGGKTQGWVVFEIDSDASIKWVRADPNPFLRNDLYFDTGAK